MSSNPINCSFCGRAKEEVDVLIAGVTGHICDNCIEQADNILQEERKEEPLTVDFQLKLPKEIKAQNELSRPFAASTPTSVNATCR